MSKWCFKGCGPDLVLPASQVQATSYAYQLAYIQWLIEQLSTTVSQLSGAVVANPDHTGDEADLEYIKIGETVYKVAGSGGSTVEANETVDPAAPALTTLTIDGVGYNVPQAPEIDSLLSLRYTFTGTVTQDTSLQKITMTIDHDDIPDNAVIERAVVFGQYNTYFMQVELDFTDSGYANIGPIKPTDDHSYSLFMITKTAGSTTTDWTIGLSGSDNANTGLFDANSDISQVRLYYHIPA